MTKATRLAVKGSKESNYKLTERPGRLSLFLVLSRVRKRVDLLVPNWYTNSFSKTHQYVKYVDSTYISLLLLSLLPHGFTGEQTNYGA